MAEVREWWNFQEQIDKLFGKIYLSMPDKFSRHNWKSLSEAGYDATDFDINKVANEKTTVLFIPTPTKETTYSIYEQKSWNPFKLLEAMKFIRGWVTVEEAKSLLTLNLTANWRDIVVLFPNPRSETVDVYIIEKAKYQTQEVLQWTASDIGDILTLKSVDLWKWPNVDNTIIK